MSLNVQVLQGDITKLSVDAIVNAANSSLLGGGGVDGAIHRAAGPDLVAECRLLGGCKTGQAKITKGYALPAKYVIHTVGPVWQGGDKGEVALLEACYAACLQIALDRCFKSIAFPCISTGIYKFPKDLAAETALTTVANALPDTEDLQVTFCCYEKVDFQIYSALIDGE